MRVLLPIAAALSLSGCGGGGPAETDAAGNGAEPAPGGAAAGPAEGASWDLVASGEGTALALAAGGERALTLFCPSGRAELVVNVPAFRPVGSEERMTFGSGGEAATLVADPRGDAGRGGVTGAGAVPADLDALIAGPVGVNYGAQDSGPHPAPPADLARGFAAACRDRAAARPDSPAPPPARPDPAPPSPPQGVGACLVQGEERLRNPPLRAIGTEPFWNAHVEGRCVTYSHPEDQKGTRVWTRYTAGEGGGGSWAGALEGRRFELAIRPRPGCSDGMSDRRYPYAAELLVGGERRRGCAEPR